MTVPSVGQEGLTGAGEAGLMKPVSNPSAEQLEWCARLMSQSQPWLTLGRDLAHCRGVVFHPLAEVTLAVAEQPLGFVVVRMDGCFRGYIQSVAVDPLQRSRGVGGTLIGWAEERILRDCPNVFICVSSFNPGALALYTRLGYQQVGILTDYIIQGQHELLLRKTSGPLQHP